MDLDFEKKIIELEEKITGLKKLDESADGTFDTEIAELQTKLDKATKRAYSKLTPWQIVQIARHPRRPLIKDYIKEMTSEFLELHGDRCFGDDRGIIGGFATIDGQKVMLLGHQKGTTTEENVACNFGMASPEGYRKALRLMKLAESYSLPVVSLIDTPGAYPGAEAEARGQAEAIARNLTEMSVLEVPVIVIITGEGGSGGAIGIGVGDSIMMLSNSVYSVISPEGCASILWRDGTKAPEAANALKITAESLKELGIIDEIIPEPEGGAHRNRKETIQAVKHAILKDLKRLNKTSPRKLVDRRYAKFAAMGKFF
jgi:acetyl-CoA carboxylase carboxyl transferase subunit alpha